MMQVKALCALVALSSRNFGIHLGFWDSQATPSMVIFGSLGIGLGIPLKFVWNFQFQII
jgi:hypothetical protein